MDESTEETIVLDGLINKTFTLVYKGFNNYQPHYCNTKYDELTFENSEEIYFFYHQQQCCEDVYIEDIEGDLKDLENRPLLQAEKYTKSNNNNDYEDYTFYRFCTIKGSVTVRWCGESQNYSTEVDLGHMLKNTGD